MNENSTNNEVIIDKDINDFNVKDQFHSKSNSFKSSSSNETDTNIKKCNHQHNSKCFITEVFMYGIKVISQMENVSSSDAGFVEGYALSSQGSIGSEQSQIISSGTSSEGFHEMDIPTISTAESHLDHVLNRINVSLRISLCESCNALPKLSDSFYKSLERVLVFFQEKYHSSQWLCHSATQLTEIELQEARSELCSVYESMFSERINWGRIVAMIGFVGELSTCALNADRIELIEEYIYTSVCYLHDNLMTWIVDHGGWEGLVDFEIGQMNNDNDMENVFGNLGRLAGVAALALAGMVLCKYVADHI